VSEQTNFKMPEKKCDLRILPRELGAGANQDESRQAESRSRLGVANVQNGRQGCLDYTPAWCDDCDWPSYSMSIKANPSAVCVPKRALSSSSDESEASRAASTTEAISEAEAWAG
jgi:hypothetical protein